MQKNTRLAHQASLTLSLSRGAPLPPGAALIGGFFYYDST